MIRQSLDFLRAQQLYLFFLGLLSLVYAVLLLVPKPLHPESVSPQYQAFQKAEKKLQTELSTPGNLEDLYRRKPAATAAFIGYSALFGALFFTGFLLDSLLVFHPGFRRRFVRIFPLEPKPWALSFLLRVVVHFLALSLAVNLLFSGAVGLFPGLNVQMLALIHTGLMDAAMALLILRELGFSWNAVRSFGFDLKGRPWWGEAGFGLGGYLAVIPVFAAILALLVTVAQMLSYEPQPHPLVDVFLSEQKQDQWLIGFSIFLACVWGPFFEEVFFRGLCYPLFKRMWGGIAGALASSFLFALIHHNEFAFLPIFILGLGLTLLYEKRGNLAAPVALHIFHNTLFIGYFFSAKALLAPGP